MATDIQVPHRFVTRMWGEPFSSDADAVQATAIAEARLLGAPAGELAACVAAVTHALAHPILASAREAQRFDGLRRETPVLLALPDRTLVEGVVDLAFRAASGGSWTVVDFKTDAGHDPAVLAEAYRPQMLAYALAAQRTLCTPVREVILFFLAADREWPIAVTDEALAGIASQIATSPETPIASGS